MPWALWGGGASWCTFLVADLSTSSHSRVFHLCTLCAQCASIDISKQLRIVGCAQFDLHDLLQKGEFC
jgi:hypothetical protein